MPDVDLTIKPSTHGDVVLSFVTEDGCGFRNYTDKAHGMTLSEFVSWLDRHHFATLRPWGLLKNTRWFLHWP